MLLLILLPSTSPKFLKEIVLAAEFFGLILLAFRKSSSDFFENFPRRMPTVIQARIWVQRSSRPVLVSPKSPIPTLLKINKGPRIIGKSKASGWEIVKISSSFKTPNSLINSKILVTDGKKVVKGTIVKASIVGGGATSPATEDGLPPVDE